MSYSPLPIIIGGSVEPPGPPPLSDYDTAIIDDVSGVMWYDRLAFFGTPDWPDLDTVMTGNYASESVEGHIWFGAWYADSGYAPADYQEAVDTITAMWFSPLDELILEP